MASLQTMGSRTGAVLNPGGVLAAREPQGASLSELLSLTVWGVMLGGIIALGAIGLTLVYGVLKFPNFAHGELVTLGAYGALTFAALLPAGPPMRPFSFGWELLAGLILSMPIVSLIALAVDRVLFRPSGCGSRPWCFLLWPLSRLPSFCAARYLSRLGL